MKTDVLITGAGPTGLMLANQLSRFGVDFLIVDTKGGPTEQSRALAVTARSMELYQQLDLAGQVIADANFINGLSLYSEGKRKADVWLADIGTGFTDFSNPMIIFEQSKNENLLNQNLIDHGRNVLWYHEFVSSEEHDDGITVVVKNVTDQKVQIIEAKYLIGCDGAKSAVRHQGDFKFEGGTYENKFYVVDAVIDWEMEKNKLIMVPEDEIFCAFFPMKTENQYRIIGTLPQQFADKEDIDFDALGKVIKQVTRLEMDFKSVGWHAIYKLHHRSVDTFSKGRIFLAGDAAHIHSPAGGQGMNTGLQDAHNLSWKLAYVLKGIAKPALLNTYNEERLPFAHFLLNYTDRLFSFMAGGSWLMKFFRKHVLMSLIGKLMKFNKVRTLAFKTVSQLFYTYAASSLTASHTSQKLAFKAGDKLPRIENQYLTQFKEPLFHLIHIGNTDLNADVKPIFPFEVKVIENRISEAWKKFGVSAELFILIRPDHHILYIADQLDRLEVQKHLGKYFNRWN